MRHTLRDVYSYRHNRNCLCAECGRGGRAGASIGRWTPAWRACRPACRRPNRCPRWPAWASSNEPLARRPGRCRRRNSTPRRHCASCRVWTPDAARLARLNQTPQRALGSKRSYLRDGTELRLDVEWGATRGYVVLVSQDEESTLEGPASGVRQRRARQGYWRRARNPGRVSRSGRARRATVTCQVRGSTCEPGLATRAVGRRAGVCMTQPQLLPGETVFADELRSWPAGTGARPPGWQLTPRAVVTFIVGSDDRRARWQAPSSSATGRWSSAAW